MAKRDVWDESLAGFWKLERPVIASPYLSKEDEGGDVVSSVWTIKVLPCALRSVCFGVDACVRLDARCRFVFTARWRAVPPGCLVKEIMRPY